jgi:hypothetical protein
VSSSRWLQTTSAEQRTEDVREGIEIGRAAPEQFEVEADYDLARFIDAIATCASRLARPCSAASLACRRSRST